MFVHSRRVERVTLTEVTGMRRSLAMSPTMTRAETERLLTEVELLLTERDQAVTTLERLGPAFAEVRAALNDLYRTIYATTQS